MYVWRYRHDRAGIRYKISKLWTPLLAVQKKCMVGTPTTRLRDLSIYVYCCCSTDYITASNIFIYLFFLPNFRRYHQHSFAIVYRQHSIAISAFPSLSTMNTKPAEWLDYYSTGLLWDGSDRWLPLTTGRCGNLPREMEALRRHLHITAVLKSMLLLSAATINTIPTESSSRRCPLSVLHDGP